MAVRRKIAETELEPVMPVMPVTEPKQMKLKWPVVVVLVLLGLGLFWWKTNTWPLIAMVGLRPVTRFEVDQALYKQSGKDLIENIITQRIIENELNKSGVQADPAEIEKQLNDAKRQLPAGQDFETELAKQGLDLATVKNLISLQIRLNKLVAEKITVTPDEVTTYIKENGQYMAATNEAEKKVEAELSVKQQKQNEEIKKWVESVSAKAKVWRFPTI